MQQPRTGFSAAAHFHRSTASHRSVRVVMLDKQELIIHVENKSARVSEIFNQTCQNISLKETEYFGLAIRQDGEFRFVSNDTKLHKVAPKVWKAKDCPVDEPLITFYFRVQFYVDNIGLLKERATRLQYYLQLRDNLLHYSQSVTEEKCFLLAGLALQADYGVYNQERHGGAYFNPQEFFPAWVLVRRGLDYVTHHLPSIHSDMSGMSRAEARVRYIRDLSTPPSTHNMHFYRLRRRKYDPPPGNDWVAVCPKGIEIYEEAADGCKNLLSTFLWSNIGKLSCEKKKFEIVADGFAERRFVYYASSRESGEHLLDMCRATHRFQLERQPILSELRRLEEHDRRGVDAERYVYSESRADSPSDRDRSRASSTPAGGGSGSERRSILRERYPQSAIRGASSPPAAPGFCSSTPISGEMRPMEIMIDSPPQNVAGNSSLAPESMSSLTMVTPITTNSAKWTTSSYDTQSGADSHVARASSRHLDQHQHSGQQSSSTTTTITPPQSFGAGRGGSFLRVSGSSTDGRSHHSGRNAPRSAPPLSILKPSPMSLVADNSFAPSTSVVVTTPINAASLQRVMPRGAHLNDVIADLWSGKSVAVHSVPQRKSSLVYPRSTPSPGDDAASVMRSTSLRQPMRPEADSGLITPRLAPASARTDLTGADTPQAVEAHFQRMPFNPLTVISNPVYVNHGNPTHSSTVAEVYGQPTVAAPGYHLPPAYFQTSSSHGIDMTNCVSTPSQSQQLRSNIGNAVSQYDVPRPNAVEVVPSLGQFTVPAVTPSRHFFDRPDDVSISTDNVVGGNVVGEPASSSARYRLVPIAYNETTVPRMPQVADVEPMPNAAIAQAPAAVRTAPPPSYEMAQSFKMAAAAAAAMQPADQRYANESRDNSSLAPTQSWYPSNGNFGGLSQAQPLVPMAVGPAPVSQPAAAQPVAAPLARPQPALTQPALQNGHREQTNGYVNVSALSSRQLPATPSDLSTPVTNNGRVRHLPRQGSSTSSDSAELAAQCPQHGSRIDLVQMLKSNIDSQSVPMLKALCNDRSLLTSCTCRSQSSAAPASAAPPERRMSLGQPVFTPGTPSSLAAAYQPGTVVRPYSWSNEQYRNLLGLWPTEIDLDGSDAVRSNGCIANGKSRPTNGAVLHAAMRGLMHRHSDGAAFEPQAFRPHTAPNHHSDSLAPHNFVAAS